MQISNSNVQDLLQNTKDRKLVVIEDVSMLQSICVELLTARKTLQMVKKVMTEQTDLICEKICKGDVHRNECKTGRAMLILLE